jgi:hypothetical protein
MILSTDLVVQLKMRKMIVVSGAFFLAGPITIFIASFCLHGLPGYAFNCPLYVHNHKVCPQHPLHPFPRGYSFLPMRTLGCSPRPLVFLPKSWAIRSTTPPSGWTHPSRHASPQNHHIGKYHPHSTLAIPTDGGRGDGGRGVHHRGGI